MRGLPWIEVVDGNGGSGGGKQSRKRVVGRESVKQKSGVVNASGSRVAVVVVVVAVAAVVVMIVVTIDHLECRE